MSRREFVRIATATLKAALTVINPGLRERLNAIGEWAAQIFPAQPDYEISQRDLQRQFESVIDRSSKDLENLSRREEYAALAPNDVTAALLAATDTLNQASQLLTAEQLIRRALTPTDAVRLLTPALEARLLDAQIPDGAQRLARLMIDACCYQLVNWAIAIPSVQNTAAWTILANSMSLINTTQEILQDLRRTGLAQAREPDRIITAQRRDVASLLGKMELFGLPVEARYRLIPISVSYVMANGTVPSAKRHDGTYSFTEIVTGALIGRGSRRYIKQSLRLLVVGAAGSGKTTAAQWLAYQSAIGKLGDLSPVFAATIPIFVRLRDVLTQDLATPPDSALIMSGQLRETLGPDWIEALSGQYEPLIVLDGWDEVKVARRPRASAWLASLAERFPNSHIVVTTRPDGADDEIFEELEFHRAHLSPLTVDRRLQLVDRWFKGLRTNLAQSPELDDAYLADAQAQIVRDLSTPVLADVVDTPLFAAMVCCLYATTKMRGPLGKGSLFQMVANALIHYRDEQQEIRTGMWNKLDLGHKEILLGEIAVTMAENGLLELPQSSSGSPANTIEGIVEGILPSFGYSASHKDVIAGSMMNRCAVLQPVGDSAVEFVHRTFQDYFAGSLLARRLDAARLIALAKRDARLLSIFPFATYAAGVETADKIMDWLLKASKTKDTARRRQMMYMIVECLAAAKQVKPSLRADAVTAVGSLFPPGDAGEARALSRLGDAAVTFLEAHLWSTKYDEYCIDALVRIATPKAIDALADYARLRGEANAKQLAAVWDRISDPNYPDAVLGAISTGLRLTARTKDRIKKIGTLPGTSAIECESVDISAEEIDMFASLPRLRSLSITRCTGVIGDPGFARIGGLLHLTITDHKSTARWSHVGPTGLKSLVFDRVSAHDFNWNSILGNCRQLEALRLQDVKQYQASTGLHDVSPVPDGAIGQLRRLHILEIRHSKYGFGVVSAETGQGRLAREVSGAVLADLGFAPQCRDVRVLRISEPLSNAGMDNLAAFEDLRVLDVTLAGNYQYTTALRLGHALLRLSLNGGRQLYVQDLTACPQLQSLRLHYCNVPSIATLPLPGTIRGVYLNSCNVGATNQRVAGSLDMSGATSLEIVDGTVDNLDFLSRFPALKKFVLKDVDVVRDVSGISFIPNNCEVTIEGLPEAVDDEPIEELREQHRCFISYERRLTWEYQADSGGS